MLHFDGERGYRANTKIFSQHFLYISILSLTDTMVEVKAQFIDAAKSQSLAYVTKQQTKKLDTSMTGIDEPILPPQDKMIANFVGNKQNWLDLKAMIEETKKEENADFG